MSETSTSRQVASIYPESTKLNALKLWLITGNLREVSASMDIKYDTLKSWKASKWWQEMSEDIRTEGHISLSHKMQQVANKAIEVTMDRLVEGDWVVNPVGGLLRKPVNMRDAHQAAISFQDRALKLETGTQTEAAPAVVDRLQAIADAFTLMMKPRKKVEVIDVAFTELLPDVEETEGGVPEEEETPTEEGEGLDGEPMAEIPDTDGLRGDGLRDQPEH